MFILNDRLKEYLSATNQFITFDGCLSTYTVPHSDKSMMDGDTYDCQVSMGNRYANSDFSVDFKPEIKKRHRAQFCGRWQKCNKNRP